MEDFRLWIPPNSEGYTGYANFSIPTTADVETSNVIEESIADHLEFYET